MLFVFTQIVVFDPKVTFRVFVCASLGAWSKTGRLIFLFCCRFCLRLDCYCLIWIQSSQTGSQPVSLVSCKTGCLVVVFYSPQTKIGFSRFLFVLDDGCRRVHRTHSPFHVVEKVINFSSSRIGSVFLAWCFITLARHSLCLVGFLHCSFYFRSKRKEGDLFWIYVLDSERVFVCCTVFLQGGLTGFWFKLLMNDGRLGFPFPLACSCETRTKLRSLDWATEKKTKMEGARNNFSYARSCRTSFQKMGVQKLKICKFSLVSKICCFFGSLSCVFHYRWFDGWNVVAKGETVFLLD